jgi:pimeloyl-ACP methyl ester carboxylesterase
VELSYQAAPTRTVDVAGTPFAYRQVGPDGGVPVVLLHHWGAVLDDWDPRVVDGLAVKHRVLAFDNRGIGASGGSTAHSVAAMARDAVEFIRALGLDHVDLVGFSLGGFIAQVIAQQQPRLVRKMVLAGTGPAGGEGIDRVGPASMREIIRAVARLKHPKHYLFFTRTENGQQAAREFLARLKERTRERDKSISPVAMLVQLKAIHAWGRQEPADLSGIRQPVLVTNGEDDLMVPTSNSIELARRLPNAELVLYPDAGHGGIFQYHGQFVDQVLTFLES